MSVAAERERASALDELGDAFKRALGAVRRLRGRDTHRLGGLSYAQAVLLFKLSERDKLPARELACAADLSPATVTEMLDALAAAGLVERERSEHDKRIVLSSLTERGSGLVGEYKLMWEARWREALAEFDDDQLRTAASVLTRLQEMFDSAVTAESN
jgi:DNA-binding MarR family transcriptional regulator